MNRTLNRVFLAAAVVIVVVVVVLGFMTLGSPAKNRAIALDDRRLADLYNIANAVYGVKYNPAWPTSTTIPVSLEAMKQSSQYGNVVTTDPADKPYTYRVTGTSTFELCDTFEIEHQVSAAELKSVPANAFWNHPAGEYCFQFSTAKYPPYYYYDHYYPSSPSVGIF